MLDHAGITSIGGIPVESEHPYPVFVLRLPDYYAADGRGRVRVAVDGERLTVEKALAKRFRAQGFLGMAGEMVHRASFAMAGKYLMSYSDFLPQLLTRRVTRTRLQALFSHTQQALANFLGGGQIEAVLTTLQARWTLAHNPILISRFPASFDIQPLCEFFRYYQPLTRRWLRWYDELPYTLTGAPDLFLWNSTDGRWIWIEVKSVGDKLKKHQDAWLKGFWIHVDDHVATVRLLPVRTDLESDTVTKQVVSGNE